MDTVMCVCFLSVRVGYDHESLRRRDVFWFMKKAYLENLFSGYGG